MSINNWWCLSEQLVSAMILAVDAHADSRYSQQCVCRQAHKSCDCHTIKAKCYILYEPVCYSRGMRLLLLLLAPILCSHCPARKRRGPELNFSDRNRNWSSAMPVRGGDSGEYCYLPGTHVMVSHTAILTYTHSFTTITCEARWQPYLLANIH